MSDLKPLERIAVALEEKAEIEHPDKGYLDSKTYMERIADAVEQLPSGGITPSGNIEITENTAEPLNIAQYATATVNVPSSGVDFVIPEQTISTTASGDVPIQTNFPRVLPTYIILQMIGEAYGQTLHGLVVMSHSYGGGVEEYKANMSFGTSVITINVISLDGGTNWGMNVKVDDVQTAFTGILISAIGEWQTTPV